jgi:hypothetical protein
MGKGVRTVQRWEQDFGLPVRRPQGSSKKAVLARPRDLDAWVALRCGHRAGRDPVWSEPPRSRTASLSFLSCLASGIETSRLLHDSNRELIREVSLALDNLRNQLNSLYPGR